MVATVINSAFMKMVLSADMTLAPDLGTAAQAIPYEKRISFTDGAGANQINTVWQDVRQIAASTTEDIDLAGGISDVFGNVLTLTKLKGIFIFAHATNTNNLLIGGDAASIPLFGAVNDLIVIYPGSFFAVCNPNAAGYTVTASTGDVLQIANSGAGSVVNYDIILFGCE